MREEKNKSSFIFSFVVITTLMLSAEVAFACTENGGTFTIKEGESGCINVGEGHKIVHCTVSDLQQNANLLISHSSFLPNSNYSIPRWSVHINHNEQRITVSGVGSSEAGTVHFHYLGPFDASYSFNLTCRW